MKWQIWSEGYRATGEKATATFHGVVEAETFKEACMIKFKDEATFSAEPKPSLWGCRLFDNEDDARQSFG